MTRIEQVKADYDACKLTYEAALAKLEALGMWASQADDYLLSNTSAFVHEDKNGAAHD